MRPCCLEAGLVGVWQESVSPVPASFAVAHTSISELSRVLSAESRAGHCVVAERPDERMCGIALVHVDVGGCGEAGVVLRMRGVAQSLRMLWQGRVHRGMGGWQSIVGYWGKGRLDGHGLRERVVRRGVLYL